MNTPQPSATYLTLLADAMSDDRPYATGAQIYDLITHDPVVSRIFPRLVDYVLYHAATLHRLASNDSVTIEIDAAYLQHVADLLKDADQARDITGRGPHPMLAGVERDLRTRSMVDMRPTIAALEGLAADERVRRAAWEAEQDALEVAGEVDA